MPSTMRPQGQANVIIPAYVKRTPLNTVYIPKPVLSGKPLGFYR